MPTTADECIVSVGMQRDAEWYSSEWKGEKRGRAGRGLEMELVGGPLAGRSAYVRDTDACLWVARYGARFVVTGCTRRPETFQGAVMLGCYGFCHFAEAMRWTPAGASRRCGRQR